jgi:DNA modification methylase
MTIATDQKPLGLDDLDSPPVTKRRGRPPKKPVAEAGESEIFIAPVTAKRRGRPPKSVDGVTNAPALTKPRGRPASKQAADGVDEAADAEVLPATVDARNQLNDLTAREWIPETVSVWNQRGLGAGHPDAQIERQHPAPFSFTDVGRLIRFFTKKGHTVLDPFVGVGSTLKACAIDGRNGIGIELNPTFAELTRERLEREVRDMFSTVGEQRILEGDARDHLPTIANESVDFVVTSPPYWSILKKQDHKVRQERIEKGLVKDYGDDDRDLGRIENYDDFLKELSSIFGDCARTLKRGKYMAIIVSDFRDKSKYIMFHSDLARSMETYGMEIRGLKVLYQRHKKVFPYGYPYSYVPNIHNQYILILQKPK